MRYEGTPLDDALARSWISEDGHFELHFEGKQFALSHDHAAVVDYEQGGFTHTFRSRKMAGKQKLYPDIRQLHKDGEEFAILKELWYDSDTVHMVLVYPSDETQEIVFTEKIFLLDGQGMVYDGGPMDEALSGTWISKDERYVLKNDPVRSSLSMDGVEIRAIELNNFFYHHFSAARDDLNERNNLEMYFGPIITDENGSLLLTIDEVWYQAGHIHMNVKRPSGEKEAVVFTRQEDSIPTEE